MVKLRGKVTGRVWEITPADIHFVPEDEWLEPGEFYGEVEGSRFYYGPEDGWTADEYMDLEGV